MRLCEPFRPASLQSAPTRGTGWPPTPPGSPRCAPDSCTACLAGDTGGQATALPARPAAGDAVSAAHTGHLDSRTRRVAADTLAAFTPPTPAGNRPDTVTTGRWASTGAPADDPPPF